jgi:hypothetical protein
MNRIVPILLASLFQVGLAQTPFPLAIGNQWNYAITYQFYQPPQPAITRSFSVIGDSLMPDGLRYWILDSVDMLGGRYIRSDSGRVYYWANDSPAGPKCIVDLNDSVGLIRQWGCFGFFSSTHSTSNPGMLFSRSTTLHKYDLGGLLFAHLTLATGIGYVHYEYHADRPAETDDWQLISCTISDTVLSKTNREDDGIKTQLSSFLLDQNYPNPFNSVTIIPFRVGSRSHVSLAVYDCLGKQVAELLSKELPAGNYVQFWDATQFASGVYFCSLRSNQSIQSKRIVLIK